MKKKEKRELLHAELEETLNELIDGSYIYKGKNL
jgi:hypothetical protein